MNAIEIEGLTKDYLQGFWRKRPHRALDALTLSVPEGQVFGLVGPNGAGKSTTLKLLMRLVYPTAGSARVLGLPISDVKVHSRIGYLPEAPYFYDYLTAREFLDYCGRLFGLDRDLRGKRVAGLLEDVGLAAAADRALRGFSRGMLQRVGIAQALINDPDLVFLDEPMLGLDPVGRAELRRIILRLKEEGKTVCFSTHILSDIESLCDQVAILNEGKLHGQGRLADILSLGATALEILASGVTDEALSSLADVVRDVRKAGGNMALQIPPDRLYEIMEKLRAAHATVLSVTPVRASLEDYFFEAFGTQKRPEGLS